LLSMTAVSGIQTAGRLKYSSLLRDASENDRL
jgi:hypothetical protein